MTTIVYRSVKGSPLTSTEVDNNFGNLDTYKIEQTSSTGAAILPSGLTSERDGSPAAGYIRFNTQLGTFEGYDGSGWGSIGGGATGSVTDQVFWENDTSVTSNYTITTAKNAGTFGPVTIDNNITVTVPTGTVWTIV